MMGTNPCGAEVLLITLLAYLALLRPTLTRPGFTNFQVLFAGWVQTTGLHAVTETLVATDVARRRHHERFHRFYSRGSWLPDQWGKILLSVALRVAPAAEPIRLVLDDTLAPKKGAQVFGLGSHLDAVRSSRKRRVFTFGHCWVMLAVLIPVPFSERRWALPVLFRLYRSKRTCAAQSASNQYRKKTELGREMLDLVIDWAGQRRIELATDSAYCNDTIAKDLPDSVVLLGAMRPDAVLTAPPPGASRQTTPRPPPQTWQVPPQAPDTCQRPHPSLAGAQDRPLRRITPPTLQAMRRALVPAVRESAAQDHHRASRARLDRSARLLLHRSHDVGHGHSARLRPPLVH